MSADQDFIDDVQTRARLHSRIQSQHAVRATLQTLAGLIPAELADGLARELPAGVGDHLRATLRGRDVRVGAPHDRRQFVRRIAARTGLSEPDAAFLSLAVFERLNASLPEPLMTQVRRHVPAELRGLAAAAAPGTAAAGRRPRARRSSAFAHVGGAG